MAKLASNSLNNSLCDEFDDQISFVSSSEEEDSFEIIKSCADLDEFVENDEITDIKLSAEQAQILTEELEKLDLNEEKISKNTNSIIGKSTEYFRFPHRETPNRKIAELETENTILTDTAQKKNRTENELKEEIVKLKRENEILIEKLNEKHLKMEMLHNILEEQNVQKYCRLIPMADNLAETESLKEKLFTAEKARDELIHELKLVKSLVENNNNNKPQPPLRKRIYQRQSFLENNSENLFRRKFQLSERNNNNNNNSPLEMLKGKLLNCTNSLKTTPKQALIL